MTLVALAPRHAEETFRSVGTCGVEPIYYQNHVAQLTSRVLRKLSLYGPRRMLDVRLTLPADHRLDGVEALWMSSNTWLPHDEMDCLLDLLPKLRWVYLQNTGFDHLDLDAFASRRVMVSNTGRLQSRRVAEMAIACILASAKRLPEHAVSQRRRQWRTLRAPDICVQTVGIVGTGNVGDELAQLSRAIGFRVWGASRSPAGLGPKRLAYYDRVVSLASELGALLAESDFVVLALPLDEATRGLFGIVELGQMKRGAVLINVARGALVDEKGLCQAISRGHLASAWIDVPTRIRPSRLSRLYRTPRVMLTHNSAAASPQVLLQAFDQFVAGVKALQCGEEPANRIV